MKETEPKQASNPTKQVLVFSTRLRQDIQTACRQLENGEGQEGSKVMVKQINWSPLAKGELRSLLLSSVQRFGNKEQGKIIYSLFQNALHRITLNPFIGQATEVDNIRYITPCPDYTLFYRHSLLKIEILVLWDNSHKAGKIKSIPTGKQEKVSKLL